MDREGFPFHLLLFPPSPREYNGLLYRPHFMPWVRLFLPSIQHKWLLLSPDLFDRRPYVGRRCENPLPQRLRAKFQLILLT